MNDLATPTSKAPEDLKSKGTPADAPAPAANGKTALTDSFLEHFAGDSSLTEKAKNFAKARPWTSAALLGVAGLALLSTFRGQRS
ncbi:hypothetical protein K9B35_00250 [Sphingomonas sp. R647]|uniref:hypothetical protein n=1 Tax=Sphingomonas sp. R647 TaxID=2875233 RepID=UPI001CD269AD|nr:hypothetical protein [Sphingomonas sp. R647]MCA1196385.1 hypothetical protein [Sphingomonas sp. R647]